MSKKLILLLPLILIPVVFATSLINSTGAGYVKVNTETVNPTNCICNFSEERPCGEGPCCRANINYNSAYDNVMYPCNYYRGKCRSGYGMCYHRGVCRGCPK